MKHSFSKFAVLVIDMQNDFVEEDASTKCKNAKEIVEPIKILLDNARMKRIPIVYTLELHRADGIDFGIELEKESKHCLEGTRGAEIVEELLPRKGDYVVTKRRFSAFFETDLEILLNGLDVDTLVVTGVATEVCVRATCQDAKQKDYHVIVPRECVAGTTVEAHEASLRDIQDFLGEIVPLQDVFKRMQ